MLVTSSSIHFLHLQAPMSTQSKPVYANFSVYKGKAALSLRVGPHISPVPWEKNRLEIALADKILPCSSAGSQATLVCTE